MSQILRCENEKCLSELFYVKKVTFENGAEHIQAVCYHCKRHLRYLPQVDKSDLTQVGEITLWFGKHKGIKLKDVPLAYRQWLASTQGANPKMQDLIKTVERYNQQKGENE